MIAGMWPTIGTLLLLSCFAVAIEYPTYDLNSYCDSTITLANCGSVTSGIAGSLRFGSYPRRNCSVVVEFGCQYQVVGAQYALYFNVKNFHVNAGDSVNIYKDSFEQGGHSITRTLVKKLLPEDLNNNAPVEAVKSVAQLLLNPSTIRTEITFVSGEGYVTGSWNSFTVDYNIIKATESGNDPDSEVLCSALKGYISRALYCDTETDRVNCPQFYNSTLGFNPTSSTDQGTTGNFGAQCQTFTTVTTTTRRTTTTTTLDYSYSDGNYNDYRRTSYARPTISVGVIVGTALGSLTVITILIVICCLLCRRNRQKQVQTVATVSQPPMENVYTTPTVYCSNDPQTTVQPAPYPSQPQCYPPNPEPYPQPPYVSPVPQPQYQPQQVQPQILITGPPCPSISEDNLRRNLQTITEVAETTGKVLKTATKAIKVAGNIGNIQRSVYIISPGFFGWFNSPSLNHFEPDLKTGIDAVRRKYPHTNWTGEILEQSSFVDCSSLRENIQYEVAKWYYTRRYGKEVLTVIVAPGG
ncbi:hypothetical protein BV898_14707 [Hypsibius exemplaris]|uniref:SEA domain-containing protein n=1 Tax=Hypsibius exemplaris TaxID=2072580 RepID=A0A9X6RJR1_HYPEX|nr:hypothetical protein BV898_14707 [Hypsibius exemplaris]